MKLFDLFKSTRRETVAKVVAIERNYRGYCVRVEERSAGVYWAFFIAPSQEATSQQFSARDFDHAWMLVKAAIDRVA